MSRESKYLLGPAGQHGKPWGHRRAQKETGQRGERLLVAGAVENRGQAARGGLGREQRDPWSGQLNPGRQDRVALRSVAEDPHGPERHQSICDLQDEKDQKDSSAEPHAVTRAWQLPTRRRLGVAR